MLPTIFGAWRSLVAHLAGGQVVTSSNLVVPTIFFNKYIICSILKYYANYKEAIMNKYILLLLVSLIFITACENEDNISDNSLLTQAEAVIDNFPDPYTFIDSLNTPINTLVESEPILVSGINAPVLIDIIGGSYSIDGGAFTSQPGQVESGQSVVVSHTSSSENGDVTSTFLTIGGYTDNFSSLTEVEISDNE